MPVIAQVDGRTVVTHPDRCDECGVETDDSKRDRWVNTYLPDGDCVTPAHFCPACARTLGYAR